MGLNPIQPSRTQTEKNDQNSIVFEISKKEPLKTLFVIKGRRKRTIRANARVMTPPSLFGIERKIA